MENLKNNELYAAIVREILAEFGGTCEENLEFKAGELSCFGDPLPHHLICTTDVLQDAVTDLTVHLWDDVARVVIYRDWESDTALVGRIDYGLDFSDELRELIGRVEQRLRILPNPKEAIESLVVD